MSTVRTRVKKYRFEIVVTGSGFGGSIMAMICQRLGFATALIERGKHPRFAIGESSTPLANLLLEEISEEFDLPRLRPLCKWGTWQKQMPHLPCGLKRGFTFYHHTPGQPFTTDTSGIDQLLVGASPNEQIADTHWYRPDFDHFLADEAEKAGVTYLDGCELASATEESDGMRLIGTRDHEPVEIAAGFVIDASGPRGFLHRALELPERPFAGFPGTQALFSHFQNVDPLPDTFQTSQSRLPYPPEQAAVHHVFPGGWIWVLRFNNGITSAGVASTEALGKELNFDSEAAAWKQLLRRFPSIAGMFSSARAIMPFIHLPQISFRTQVMTGRNWAMLPSAAGFVDPLLSTGFPLTLLGIKRLARALRDGCRGPVFHQSLEEYAGITMLELEATASLIGALYVTMGQFDLFKQLSLLYFAAASYSETMRRLGKPEMAGEFLLCRHPVFAPKFQRICERIRTPLSPRDVDGLSRAIREAIEPIDVAGLNDSTRDPWFPAKGSDIIANSKKAGASTEEIRAMLRRCGAT